MSDIWPYLLGIGIGLVVAVLIILLYTTLGEMVVILDA